MERITHTFSMPSIGPGFHCALIRGRAAPQARLSELRAKEWLHPRFRSSTFHLNEGILMKLTRVALLLSFSLWIATALPAQRVQTNYDHRVDFSTYKTYSWLEMTGSDSLSNQHVKDAVNSSLASKGLTQ